MGGSLDDAIRRRKADESFRESWNEKFAREASERHERFCALIDEFLKRMSGAGNPGLTWEMKVGLFRRVRGWVLTYEQGDARRRLVLREDGLVPSFERTRFESGRILPRLKDDFVQPRETELRLADHNLRTLEDSMVELLACHGLA